MHLLKTLPLFGIAALLLTLLTQNVAHASIGTRLNGKILLQVQSRGEAWYVHPVDGKRYSLGSPEMAIQVFSRIGLGISNENLSKIPLGFDRSGGLFGLQPSGEVDQDGDGIPDEYEVALGTRPDLADTDGDGYSDLDELKSGYDPVRMNVKLPSADAKLVNRLKGRILLQTESRGQAWYINPADGRRYYLGTPQRALAGMRSFGLGITNADLGMIQESAQANQCFYTIETEQFSCDRTQMLFSSALSAGDSGFHLEPGHTVTLPRNKLVSLQEPGNTDLRNMYILFLNKSGSYTLSEEESTNATQQRLQNIVDERYR